MLSKLYLVSFALFLLVSLHSAEGWRRRRRRRRRSCYARDCAVSGWTGWSQCSHPCGNGGTQTRGRAVTRGAACGGSCPYALSETRSCNRDTCSNGGTPSWGHCSCPPGYSGTCCEGGNYIHLLYIIYYIHAMYHLIRSILLVLCTCSYVFKDGYKV